MTIDFLTEYFVPVIAGLCLCAGYLVKTAVPVDGKYIPVICAALGLVLTVWMHWGALTPEVLLAGVFSGLASTGLHEAFHNLIGQG